MEALRAIIGSDLDYVWTATPEGKAEEAAKAAVSATSTMSTQCEEAIVPYIESTSGAALSAPSGE